MSYIVVTFQQYENMVQWYMVYYTSSIRSEFLSLLLISLSNLVDVDSGVCRDTWRATGPVLQTWSLTIRESRGLPVKTPRCQPQQIGDESLARAGCKYYDSVSLSHQYSSS